MNSDTSKDEGQVEENLTESGENSSQTDGAADPALAEIEELKTKLQESEKKYLYLYSDFENFRRRNERDRIDFLKFGHEGFLRDLLQVVDNFDRALSHAKSAESEKGSALLRGVEMIQYQLSESLKNQGVTPVVAIGAKFDPTLHEAVGDEVADAEPGTITKEVLKGYTLHGRLLRPARVIVAKK